MGRRVRRVIRSDTPWARPFWVWVAVLTGQGLSVFQHHSDQSVLTDLPRISNRLRLLNVWLPGPVDPAQIEQMLRLEVLELWSPMTRPISLDKHLRLREIVVAERGKVSQVVSAFGLERLRVLDLHGASTAELELVRAPIEELYIRRPPSRVPLFFVAHNLRILVLAEKRGPVEISDLSLAVNLEELSLLHLSGRVTGFGSVADLAALREVHIVGVQHLDKPSAALEIANLNNFRAWGVHQFPPNVFKTFKRRGITVSGAGNPSAVAED